MGNKMENRVQNKRERLEKSAAAAQKEEWKKAPEMGKISCVVGVDMV